MCGEKIFERAAAKEIGGAESSVGGSWERESSSQSDEMS